MSIAQTNNYINIHSICAACILFNLANYVHADDEFDRAVNSANTLRWSLGYDPISLAAMNVSRSNQITIALESIRYARKNLTNIEPPNNNLYTLNMNVWEQSTNTNPTQKLADLNQAHSAVKEAVSNLESTLVSNLNEDAAYSHSFSINQVTIDPIERLLNLTTDQLSTLQIATLTRDMILRNPYKWHRTHLVNRAWNDYYETLDQLLTYEQWKLYNSYMNKARNNLFESFRREQVAYNIASSEANTGKNNIFLVLIKFPFSDLFSKITKNAHIKYIKEAAVYNISNATPSVQSVADRIEDSIQEPSISLRR